MSSNAAIETCEWDTGCTSVATRHVRWIVGPNNDGAREKHLCDAHTADLHERPCGAQDAPVARCGAECWGIGCAQ
jgi:hypothetical protein